MTRMKPILFNTEMVRAILDGRKTVTQRVVKPQPTEQEENPQKVTSGNWYFDIPDKHFGGVRAGVGPYRPPYRPGDILYVRETWDNVPITTSGKHGKLDGKYFYKADGDIRPEGFRRRWYPSIHMPREAARIFLRCTGLNVKRVQDITDEEARREGCKDRDDFHRVWNNCYEKPKPVKVNGVITHYESYPWEDIQETRTYRGKPWYVIGNPWVWVIEFERCEKPEGGT